MTDFRAELQALIDAADSHVSPYRSHEDAWDAALDRARTLLSQPEPEGPTDEEWDALVERAWDKYQTVGYQGERFIYDHDFNNALDYVRKELARFSRPTPQPTNKKSLTVQPADGEVAELVADMREQANHGYSEFIGGDDLRRAADLLEQLSPLQPIPVSERLPGPGDCDADGRVWWLGVETWMLRTYAVVAGAAIPLGTHWLPAHALPLPSGEVE